MKYVCLKPVVDTRDLTNVIKSRIGIQRECQWIYHDTDLYDMAQTLFEESMAVIDWFLVDEAQFLTAEQVDQLSRVVDDFGSNVICYGLRTDFKSRLFEGSRRLFEIADTIDEIKSTCTCGRKTIINARIDRNGRLRSAVMTVISQSAENVGVTKGSNNPIDLSFLSESCLKIDIHYCYEIENNFDTDSCCRIRFVGSGGQSGFFA